MIEIVTDEEVAAMSKEERVALLLDVFKELTKGMSRERKKEYLLYVLHKAYPMQRFYYQEIDGKLEIMREHKQ